MKKITLIFGTRPEAIKMCPLVSEARSRGDFDVKVCITGQHRQMLDQVLDVFDIRPDHDLSIMQMGQTLFDIQQRVMDGLKELFEKERPDIALVHGDTTTSFAAALTAFYLGIPVGHVEAGLRTYNIRSPFPEEFNRQAVDSISDFLFAPTGVSRDNLLRENKNADRIYVTGNTVIDALKTTVRPDYSHPHLDWASDSRLVLLTAHRRENLGEKMRGMFSAIRRVVDENPDIKVIYPVHLNPLVRDSAAQELAGCDRIRLIEPLDVLAFHNFMAASYMVLTDSGGIQEEAPSLGKPVLVLRDTTERPEGVAAGTLKLVGTDPGDIYREFSELLRNQEKYNAMSRAVNPYGDGFASKRIVDILEREL
ncbi:MAG: UDP-N-acetylglucosamine 2-epimerase (non-hydrolyzing) [Oscillospiraceae bacterium]|nr:UDP-N-acetylglucosamine 2-epimerase (non-hydrolyzing) [Oscillospiraceae bacterium]